jgi:hypothetical protein
MAGGQPSWSESLVDLYRGLRNRSIDHSRVPDFVRETRVKIAEFMATGDLHHAAIYENILKNLVPLSYCADYVSDGAMKRNEVLADLTRLRQELRSFESVLNQDLYAHDERVCAALRAVEHQRICELRAFDLETEQGLRSSRCKFSSRVLALKKTERSLVSAHRFQEVPAMKRERIRLERAERAAWTQKYADRREEERRLLEAAHDRKCDVVKDCGLNSRELIEAEGERCLDALRQRIRNLETKAAGFQDRVLESESVLRGKTISNAARIRAKQAMRPSRRRVRRS